MKKRQWKSIPGMDLKDGETVDQWKAAYDRLWANGFVPFLRKPRQRSPIKEETDEYIIISYAVMMLALVGEQAKEHYQAWHDLYQMSVRHMGAHMGGGLSTIKLDKPGHARFIPLHSTPVT